MLLAVSLLAGSVHEVHHLGDAGDGDCVVCLIGTGGNHALPSPEVTITATRDDFLSPRFSFTSAFSSSHGRGRLIRAPPRHQLT